MEQPLPNDQSARLHLSRREVIGGGLFLGLAALSGCAGPRMRAPGPTMADTSPVVPYMPPPPAPNAPASTPTPQPMPTGGVAVLPRSAWANTGALLGSNRAIHDMNGVSRITIHHEGDTVFYATQQPVVAARLESVRRYHITRRAKSGELWADIGYHYAIDPAGRVWECRNVRYQGAHVQDENEHNLGVVVLGNFEHQTPTPQACFAVDAFVSQQMRHYNVPRSRVYTHRELGPTECPGSSLQSYMVKTRGRGGRLASAAEEMGLA